MRQTSISQKRIAQVASRYIRPTGVWLLLGLIIWIGLVHAQVPLNAQHIKQLLTQCKAQADSAQYAAADQACKQAVEEAIHVFGENHIRTAESISDASILQAHLGNYQQAKSLAQRALKIKQSILQKSDLSIATTMTNLALIYAKLGENAEAEHYLRESLRIRQIVLGEWNIDIAVSLNNLGDFLREQGQYSQAESLFTKALKITEKTAGPKDIQFARILQNLGLLCRDQGKDAEAAQFYQRAIEVMEHAVGSKNPDLAVIINNLAAIYAELGPKDQVEPLFKRALEIRKSTLGSSHPATAESLNNLGTLYGYFGKYAQAEPLLREALSIRERQLGPMHPLVASTLDRLAEFDIAKSQFNEAAVAKDRSLSILETLVSAASSEPRIRAYLERHQENLELFYSLLLQPSSKLKGLGLEATLLYKGRIAETGASAHIAILDNIKESTQQKRYQQWMALRKEYGHLIIAGPGKGKITDYETHAKELQNDIEELEHFLSTDSAAFRNVQLPGPHEIRGEIAKRLPPDSVLVDLIYSSIYDFKKLGTAREHWEPAHYIAVILFPNGEFDVHDLGEAAQIDELAADTLRELRNPRSNPIPAAEALYRKLFAPLEPKLHGVTKIFLAPDGSLNLIPFDALYDGQRYLVERYAINYLTSGRDLLREPVEIQTSPPLVLANPQFSLKAPAMNLSKSTTRDVITRNLYEQAEGIRPLPGTAREADFLKRWLPSNARILTGAMATEQALRAAQSPILEIVATHGISISNPNGQGNAPSIMASSRSNVQLATPSTKGPSTPAPQSAGSLMTGSALLLAGAGNAANASDTDHDGILTADEARMLNLLGTQLVVLSACDTGLGLVQVGQGVLGLRRAFLVAGAETLVTSLWRVDDQGTSELMQSYYKKLVRREPRLSALRSAMLDMKARHPFYWAPFIGIGRDAPLSLPVRKGPSIAKK